MTIYLGTKAVGIDYQGNFSRIDNPCKYGSNYYGANNFLWYVNEFLELKMFHTCEEMMALA